MTTEAVTPLRQRMIEDMTSRRHCCSPEGKPNGNSADQLQGEMDERHNVCNSHPAA